MAKSVHTMKLQENTSMNVPREFLLVQTNVVWKEAIR